MNENVYFECRKRAAIHNERLNSRAGAAEILGISESTLAHYELGITKNIPVDVVVMMAEVYNAPELKCIYCKTEMGKAIESIERHAYQQAVTGTIANPVTQQPGLSGGKKIWTIQVRGNEEQHKKILDYIKFVGAEYREV